ncbi:hypothetical protein [[Erwinia] mediterraneensis]|uniref:hypothetical protein n=1 Tax=[Erwinia] mediterraneensis TaxID=2161819 RepID=UPI001F1B553F|nr:hypothetical protein [[Erwinia] mediterraneensis]
MYIAIMVVAFTLAILILRALSFHQGIYHENDKSIKSITGLRCLLAALVAFSHFAQYIYSFDHPWIYNKDDFAWFSEGGFFC